MTRESETAAVSMDKSSTSQLTVKYSNNGKLGRQESSAFYQVIVLAVDVSLNFIECLATQGAFYNNVSPTRCINQSMNQ